MCYTVINLLIIGCPPSVCMRGAAHLLMYIFSATMRVKFVEGAAAPSGLATYAGPTWVHERVRSGLELELDT